MKNLGCILFIIGLSGLMINCTNAQNVQRNYLTKEYNSKGGSSCLSVDTWRTNKKLLITKKLQEIPADVKKAFLETVDNSLKEDWQTLKLSDYLKFKINGNRSEYEAMYFARRKKLNRLLIGELIEHKGKYLPDIADGLWMICEESTWVLPAHLYLQKKVEEGMADPDETVIDLFAGETGALVSWTKFLLKDELNTISPLLVKRLNYELNRRIVTPYLTRSDFWWQGFAEPNRKMNNWNIWVNTNILLTAMLALDDKNTCLQVVGKTINSADYFINSYQEDGGCDEGPGYWGAAGGRLIEFVNLLTTLSENKLDWSKNQLIHNIASYIYKDQIADNWYVDFADAPASLTPDPAKIYIAGRLFHDERLIQFGGYLFQQSGSGNKVYSGDNINDFISNLELEQDLKKVTPKAPMLQENWLPDLQVLTMRQVEGSKQGLFLGAKAGNNGESHNHNDVGSFIIYTDGQPVLIDPGAATYSKQTFSSERYKLWVYNSQWHNCPTINGFQQKEGSLYKANDVSFTNNPKEGIFSMDLTHAYPQNAGINNWTRSLTFDKTKGVISLKESYDLKELKEPFVLNFISCTPAKLESKGSVLLSGGNFSGKLMMKFDPDLFEFMEEDKSIDDARLSVWGKKIYHITLRSKSSLLKGTYNIQFINEDRKL